MLLHLISANLFRGAFFCAACNVLRYRLLGKALFDGQLVQAHLVRPLYKHLLGWPIAFSDLEHVDHFTHESLLKMTELDDVEVGAVSDRNYPTSR